MKSPTTRAWRTCAAQSCNRLELQPSRRAAGLIAGWLVAFCAMVLGAVALPLLARIVICVLAALGGVPVIRRVFLLLGPDAVRVLEWDDSHLFVRLGRSLNEACVTLATGSFQWGPVGMLLRLRDGRRTRVVFIDAGRQPAPGLRRLARWLKWPARQADTIRNKDLTCVTRHYKSFD